MNFAKPFWFILFICLSLPAMAIPKPDRYDGAVPLRYTLGQWPDMSHNTPFKRHILDRGEARYTYTLNANNTVYDYFGAWGTPNSHHFSYAFATESGLALGRDAKQTATVAYAFCAPPGNTFTGGTIELLLSGDLDRAVQTIECAVSPTLSFLPKKGFWGRAKAAVEESALSWHRPKQSKEATTLSLLIPEGAKECYVLMRGRINSKDVNPAVISSIHLNPTFAIKEAIHLNWHKAEPLFGADETIAPTIQLFPNKGSDASAPRANSLKAQWELTRNGDGIVERGTLQRAKNTLTLSGHQPGLYTLRLTWRKVTQRFEFAIFPALSPERFKQSMFGAFGQPNRRGVHGGLGFSGPDEIDRALMQYMGMRWTVASVLWAWRQKTPDSALDKGYLSIFKTLADHGFEVICTMGTTPAWASGGKKSSRPPLPQFMPHWEKHSAEVAKSLKPYVTWFQAWNEPNNPHALWQAKWNTQQRVAIAKSLQHYQYKGIVSGNSNAKLLAGNFAGVPADWVAKWLSGKDSTLHAQHGMSAHPYCKVTKEENYAHKHPAEPNFIPRLKAMRKAMDDAGAAEQPIFFTEYGWYSPLTSPDNMARWTARQNVMTAAYREIAKIKAAAIFSPGDIKNGHNILRFKRDIRGYEHRFTSVSLAFAVSAAELSGMTPMVPLSDFPSTIRAYKFEDTSRVLVSAWKTEEHHGSAEVSVHAEDTARVGLVTSVSGSTSLAVFSADEPLRLSEAHDPLYVSFYKRPAVALMAAKHTINSTEPIAITVGNVGSGAAVGKLVSQSPWLSPKDTTITLTQGALQQLKIPIKWGDVPTGHHAVDLQWQPEGEGQQQLPSQRIIIHLSK